MAIFQFNSSGFNSTILPETNCPGHNFEWMCNLLLISGTSWEFWIFDCNLVLNLCTTCCWHAVQDKKMAILCSHICNNGVLQNPHFKNHHNKWQHHTTTISSNLNCFITSRSLWSSNIVDADNSEWLNAKQHQLPFSGKLTDPQPKTSPAQSIHWGLEPVTTKIDVSARSHNASAGTQELAACVWPLNRTIKSHHVFMALGTFQNQSTSTL